MIITINDIPKENLHNRNSYIVNNMLNVLSINDSIYIDKSISPKYCNTNLHKALHNALKHRKLQYNYEIRKTVLNENTGVTLLKITKIK